SSIYTLSLHDALPISISFNQNIGPWNVENVTQMHYMFFGATNFNQDIGQWDVGNVINMSFMFRGATNFNQPIDGWNTGNVKQIRSEEHTSELQSREKL